jgi:hypothetical protein
MFRSTHRLLRLVAVIFVMTLPAVCLSSPSAHAAIEPSPRDITAVRIDATDQLALMNMSDVVVRVYLNDPVYGPQTRTLVPMADTGATPMCAITGDLNPDPTIHVTFSPDTPSAVTKTMSYYSVISDGYNVESLQQVVTERSAAAAKMKHRVTMAKAAVRKAEAILAKAKASQRAVWIKSATRWLAKTKSRLNTLKAKMAVRKAQLAAARQNLERIEGYIAYCQERRLS